MMRLKSKLLSLNASKTTKTKVFSPRNCEELRIPFKTDKTAKVVGKLASVAQPHDLASLEENGTTDNPALVTGVLVQNDFKLSLMAPEDLREYAGLNTTTITCKQRLTLSAAGIDLIKWALEGTFGTVEELPEMRHATTNGKTVNGDSQHEDEADEEVSALVAAYLVMGCVTLRYRTSGDVELEWEGNMLNDGIADAVMAVLFSVESSPAAVKRSSAQHSHSHSPEGTNPHAQPSPQDRLERLMWFLEAQFGADNVAPVEKPKLPALPAKEADAEDADAMDMSDNEDEERAKKEIERLHKIGIPVPGVSITVEKMSATVWLEDLEVECNNKVFADRVRAVVERAVEVTAPLWG
jgi:cleavage and polyadenylation specificity factor subunit 3